MTEPCRAAKVAAHWWADKLRSDFELSNGAEDEEGTIAAMALTNPVVDSLMTAVRDIAKAEVTPEKADAFEKALAQEIQDRLVQYAHQFDIDIVSLDVDYDPSPLIADALKTAGIPVSIGVLPLKTNMRVSIREVEVAAGYGQPWQKLDLGDE